MMKILLLLLLVGYVTANSPDAVLQSATDDILQHFVLGMEDSSPLHRVLGVEQDDDVQRLENDIKEELARHLRDVFEKAFKKVEEAMKDGRKINTEALEKLHELRKKMKELNIDDDEVTEKNLEQLKEQVSETLRKILEKMGILDKRSLEDPMDAVFGELNLRALFIKLKNMILEHLNVKSIKEALAKIVGQATQKLCEWLTNKGKTKVLDFFDRVLDQEEDRKRAISDVYEQIKDYFDEMDIKLKEKFLRFGEWARDIIEKGLSKTKDKIENLKYVFRELTNKSREVSKEVAKEALDFLHDYKEELGSLYDEMKDKIIEKLRNFE